MDRISTGFLEVILNPCSWNILGMPASRYGLATGINLL